MADVESRVKKLIAEMLNLDPENVRDDSSVMNDLGADSLDVVEIVMGLEEEFGVEIEDDEVEKLDTVSDVVAYMCKLI